MGATLVRTGLFLLLCFAGPFVPGPVAAAPNPHNESKCLLCHRETPRFGVDTRQTVTFRTGSADDPKLCFFCHKPEENLHPLLVEPGAGTLGTRSPARLPLGESGELAGKVVCTTCHFVHAADTDHALLRGFAGSQNPGTYASWQDLCVDCHGDGLARRSPHAGDDRACVFCHQQKPAAGGKPALQPRALALCNFCHGGLQDEHFVRANPFAGTVDCSTCHDPHLGPKQKGRLKAAYFEKARAMVTLDPHYRKALCFACHAEGESYPLRSADGVVLCNRCHGTGEITGDIHPVRKVPEGITPPKDWPLQKGFLTCLTCHRPSHPEDRAHYKFLRGGPYDDRNDFCRNCHTPDSFKGRNPHADINAGKGCEFCHAARPVPGKDTIATVRFIADPIILCVRCHDVTHHPAGTEHTLVLGEERAGTIPAQLPLYRGFKIICATCHNPHVEEVEGSKLRTDSAGLPICVQCHAI